MKLLFSFIICVCAFFQTAAQGQNYLFTNASYAFFGTGDLSGTALGIDYHRTLFQRFGLHLGYSKASGKGDNNLFGVDLSSTVVDNLTFNGNGNPTSNLATYQTFLLGFNYKVADGRKNVLLASIGANFKGIQNNYLSSIFITNAQGSSLLEIQSTSLNAEKETGVYFGLDYLYAFDNALTLGLHFSVENSSNILSKTGISLGFHF